MRRRYLTTNRVEDLATRLTPVDRQVLDTLRVARVATGLQLQRLHHGLDEAAKQRRIRQLARLSRLRLVTRLQRRIGGIEAGSMSSVYSLDVAGQRVLNVEQARTRVPWTPSTPFIAHALAVAELYIRLRLAEQVDALQVVHFEAEPDCWRAFVDRRGRRIVLKPDAHLIVAAGDYEHHWFVEVDRATEAPRRVAAKSRLYVDYWNAGLEQVRHDVFPRILWLAPNDVRKQQLVDAVATIDARHSAMFSVTNTAAFIDTLVGTNGALDASEHRS